MSTAKHEASCSPIDHDVEIRIRNFKNFTIAALGNFTVLIVLMGMLQFWIETVPSTIPMPFLLRWACIVVLYLGTIAKNAWLFQIIIAITRGHLSKDEDEKRSRKRDLGTRITDLEDWILANFCVVVGLSTMGFVAWYWIQIFTLAFRTFFYWTCTMAGLCSLLWLLKRTTRSYRGFKGVKHEEAWGILVGLIVVRFYDKFEGLKASGVLGQFLDAGRVPFEVLKFLLDVVGFRIGRGPLFDRLSDEWKAARRACKTPADVTDFFAVFAGSPDEVSDDKEDAQDRNDEQDACFHPSVFEFQPNPVISHHLRDEHLQPSNFSASVSDSTSDYCLIDTARAAGSFCPDMTVDLDDDDDDDDNTTKNDQKSPSALRHTGPATMSVVLSSFECPQCTYVAEKRFKLNKHISQKHNLRFKCDYQGCGEIFGLRKNLERHELIHTERTGFQCPNAWCKTPGQIILHKDNLERHMKRCGTSG